jgi:hypothetical protein
MRFPLWGKRRQALEAQAHTATMDRLTVHEMRRELERLRRYIDSEMKKHFQVYNGGALRQMQTLCELNLPTPWVPEGIRDAGEPIPPFIRMDTITYVREQRFVPIRQAGKI